jgi:hypothetical protein
VDFEIESGVWAKGAMIARIGEKRDGLAFVWRRDFPGFAIYTEKWDLLGSMAAAAAKKPACEIPQSEYRVKVSAIYRDSFNVWYRSQADLIYIPTQRRLTFGPTTQERCGAHPEREAFAKLAGSPPGEDDSPQTPAAEGKSEEKAEFAANPATTERDELLRSYKARGSEQSIRITDKMVAHAANPNWNDRSMIAWWKRNDPRCNHQHDRLIRGVLGKDPSSFWYPKPKRRRM